MLIETGPRTRFDSISIKVPTTAGNMFVVIMEQDRRPVGIQLNIGKAGGEMSTLAHALARVCSLVLDRGGSITELIQELSGHVTDKLAIASNGAQIRSVIEGLTWALIEYNRERYAHQLKLVGDTHPRLGG